MFPQIVEYLQLCGRFQRNARLYLISNVLSGVTANILLVLYNLYLASLGYGTDFIGLVLFVVTIGAGIAIFPAGICIDRLSGRFILIWSSLLIGLAGIGQILFRQPIPLLISGFIAGAAGAFILVINAPFLTRNSTPAERPHLFSLNLVLSLITGVIGSVLGGALPGWFHSIPLLMGPLPTWLNGLFASQPNPRSYQFALLFAGAIALPSFIPLFLMSDDRPGRNVQTSRASSRRGGGGGDGERGALWAPVMPMDQKSGLQVTSTGRTATMAPTPLHTTPAPTRIWSRFSIKSNLSPLLHSPLLLLALVQACIGAGAGLFIPYFNIYFVQHLGASPALFGVLNGGATAINALLTLAAPWLAMRLGKVNSIALTELVSIPLLITLGLIPLLPVAAVCYLFRQGFMDMSNGVLQVFSMEAVPERYRGLANSSYQVAFQVPWALTAPLGGVLIAHVGYPAVFLGGAVCYLLACGTLWRNFGGKREKRFEEVRV
jgi:MFS family permease